jgi:anthraniloyl-CoA monooxygenase
LASHASEAAGTRAAAGLFGETLAPESLTWVPPAAGASSWRQFVFVTCARWHCGNVVLLGDAAHTTHYSVGAGTKNAFADAIALQRNLLTGAGSIDARLAAYTAERIAGLRSVQWLSDNSNRWFEQRPNWDELTPEQFACALLSRTKQHGAAFTPAQLERMSALGRRQRDSTRPHRVGAFALTRVGGTEGSAG